MTEIKTTTAIAEDTLIGLSSKQKFLSSKYFYDENGSRIFQDIMHMPEYYLTDCEFEIFDLQKQSILEAFSANHTRFDLIELGAGDGYKTKILLSWFLQKKKDFTYMPIDISSNTLSELATSLKIDLPTLQIDEQAGDYFEMMEYINSYDSSPKIILFLGSNIGNFSWQESVIFLRHIKEQMKAQDQLFIGFDLKKDPRVIMNAYDDPHGNTRDFNLNLLERLNRELGANFRVKNFRHHAVYDPVSGAAKSYLVSLTDQQVDIDELETSFHFKPFETIYTEMSQKYNLEMIEELAYSCGFEIKQNFYDSKRYFVNSLWKLKT